MARKLKISLASSLSNQPVLATVILDGQVLMNGASVSAISSNYSTYEFDISTGDHTLAIRMESDEMLDSITDLNLVVGPIQLSKLDGTYHPNLYIIPDPANNLNVNDEPNLLITQILFSAGDELLFSFDSENPVFFRNYNEPTPTPPNFEDVTGQTESEWVDGQIVTYDELKYQCKVTNDINPDDNSPIIVKTWMLLT